MCPDNEQKDDPNMIDEITRLHNQISNSYTVLNSGLSTVGKAYKARSTDMINNLNSISELYKKFTDINLYFQEKMNDQLNKYADQTLELQKKYADYFEKK